MKNVGNALDSRESNVTNGLVAAIVMWGYTPVRITGVLVLTCLMELGSLSKFFVCCG